MERRRGPSARKGTRAIGLAFLLLLVVSLGRPARAQFVRLFGINDLAPGSIEFTSPLLGTGSTRAGDTDGDGLDDLLLTLESVDSGTTQVLLVYGQPLSPGEHDPLDPSIRKSMIDVPDVGLLVGGGVDVNGDGRQDFFIFFYDYLAVVFGSRPSPPASKSPRWEGRCRG